MSKIQVRLVLALAAASACLMSVVAIGASTTLTFTRQITTAAACTIDSVSALNFAMQGIQAADVDQTSTIQIQCTDTTPYAISLDAGTGAGATVTVTVMY